LNSLNLTSRLVELYAGFLFEDVRDFIRILITIRSRDSSVSIVSDYGLNDRANGVRSPAGAKDFSSSLCVQTGSEAHPASCTVGTGGPFPGEKRVQGVTLTTHPTSNAEVKNE
jgi:hypothetical protein